MQGSEQGDLVAGGELGSPLVRLCRGEFDGGFGQGEVLGDVGPAAAVLSHVGGEILDFTVVGVGGVFSSHGVPSPLSKPRSRRC